MSPGQEDLTILVDSGIAIGIYGVLLAVVAGFVVKGTRDRRSAPTSSDIEHTGAR